MDSGAGWYEICLITKIKSVSIIGYCFFLLFRLVVFFGNLFKDRLVRSLHCFDHLNKKTYSIVKRRSDITKAHRHQNIRQNRLNRGQRRACRHNIRKVKCFLFAKKSSEMVFLPVPQSLLLLLLLLLLPLLFSSPCGTRSR